MSSVPLDLNNKILVGRTPKNKQRKYSYRDLEYDEDKWADSNKYLPLEFDLCFLKTVNKTISGWFTGQNWEGLRLKDNDRVLFWKYIPN